MAHVGECLRLLVEGGEGVVSFADRLAEACLEGGPVSNQILAQLFQLTAQRQVGLNQPGLSVRLAGRGRHEKALVSLGVLIGTCMAVIDPSSGRVTPALG